MGAYLATLPYAHQPQADLAFLLETVGKLWLLGTTVQRPGFYQHEQRHRLTLPTYPFHPDTFWLQGKSLPMAATPQPTGWRRRRVIRWPKNNQFPRQE